MYRNGYFEEAIEHLEKAMAAFAGEAFDLFFLAMDHWQLGRKQEARSYYDRAVAWMDEHSPRNPVLIPVREEASRLLGIEEGQPAS